jgi:hypothetical protein
MTNEINVTLGGAAPQASGGTTWVPVQAWKPTCSELRIPAMELPTSRWQGPSPDLAFLDAPETAALLRAELRRHFPGLRCTVRVTHRWHGWIRVRVTGPRTPLIKAQLDDLCANLTLLRFDSVTDDRCHHQIEIAHGEDTVRVTNSVRWIEVEWNKT